MSQLSNEKHKMSAISKLIIYLVILAIFSVGITTFAIYFMKNKDNASNVIENNIKEEITDDKKNNTNKVNEDNLKIANIAEKFDSNSLEVNTVNYNEIETGTKANGKTYKINLKYDQISGLKNSTVEKQINDEIKEKAFENIKDSYKTDNTINNINIVASICGNFGDVLSVNISGNISYKKLEEKKIDVITLNYRLDNGKKIEFSDLFINDAPINSIIADSAYKELAWREATEMGDKDMSKVDYSEYEEESANMVALYKMDKAHKFYFTPQKIYLYITGVKEAITIEMAEYYSNIAIYKRFKSNTSLYTDTTIGLKNSLVFTNRLISKYDFYKEVTDNMFGIIRLNLSEENSEINVAIENMKIELNKLMDNKKNKLDKSKGIIYMIDTFGYYDKVNKQTLLTVYEQTASMELDYYKNNVYRIISEFERKPKSSVVEPLVTKSEKNVKLTENTIDLKFDSKGKLVK